MKPMDLRRNHLLSRRHFCLCCMTGAAFAATGGWLTPRQAFAEARGLVTLIKDSAASSPVTAYNLRGKVTVLEGSGGNIAVLTGPDEKVLIDAGISVSRPQLTKALSDLGTEPVTHLINTHWHFDHTDGNEWLHSVGAKIIAHENANSCCGNRIVSFPFLIGCLLVLPLTRAFSRPWRTSADRG